MLVQVGGFNLSLVMRKLIGRGNPRGLQGLFSSIFGVFLVLWKVMATVCGNFTQPDHRIAPPTPMRMAA